MRVRQPPLYRVAKFLAPPLARAWVRLDLQGLERIPRRGPLIFAANHTSYLDWLFFGVFIDTAGYPVRFLAKAELFDVPFLGWVLTEVGQIPVLRNTRQAHRSLEAAVLELAGGAAVAIYPEGTTTRDPDFMPMRAKNGLARLAAYTGAPVIPVAIWGAHLLFARHVQGPYRPGIRVVVRAGPPVHLGLDRHAPIDRLNLARDRVMAEIDRMVVEVRAEWREPTWYRQWRTRRAGPGWSA